MAKEEILILKVKLEADPGTIRTQEELIKRNRELLKLLRQVPREGEEGFEELQQAAEKARQEYVRNRQEIQKFNKELRQTKKDVPTDSLKGMSNRLRELEKEYRELSAEQRKAFGPKLQREILKTRNALKEAEASIGDYRRNVGNYEKSIDRAIKKNQLFNRSFRSTRDVVRAAFGGGFFGSLAANAVGFFDGLIDGARESNPAIARVGDSMDRAAEAVTGVAESVISFVSAPLSALLDGFSSITEAVGDFLDPFSAAQEAFQEQSDFVKQLETEFVPLIDTYKELSQQTELSAEEQEELTKATQGIADVFPGAITEVDEYGNAIAVSTDAAEEFVKTQIELQKILNADAIEKADEDIAQLEAQIIRAGNANKAVTDSFTEQGKELAKQQKIREDALLTPLRTQIGLASLADDVTGGLFKTTLGLNQAEEESTRAKIENEKAANDQLQTDLELLRRKREARLILTGEKEATQAVTGAYAEQTKALSAAETALRDAIAGQGDFSAELRSFLAAQERVNESQETFNRVTAEGVSAIEALGMAESELTKQIQNLALAGRDSSKQEEELIEIREKQAIATESLDRVNNALLSTFERQQQQQSDLQREIQEAIANGEPYQEQLEQLRQLTITITQQTLEYTEATKDLGKETETITQGSLADYQQRIKAIEEQQEDLNIQSSEYAELTAEIDELETRRNRTLELLNTSLEELTAAQTDANNALLDQAAVSEALQRTQEQLLAVEGLTQESADKRKEIEEQLQQDLEAIQRASVERRIQQINNEIALLIKQKEEELAIEGQTEEAKAKIRSDFGAQIATLGSEQSKLQNDLLQQDIDNFQDAEDKKVAAAKAADAKIRDGRKERIKQVVDLSTQAVQGFGAIIRQTQDQERQAEVTRLEDDQKRRLQNLEATGATETEKQELLEKFEAENEALNKRQAQERKKTAITEAIINTFASIAKTLATLGVPAGIPASIIAGALGFAQVAAISAQKFGRGGLPKGRRHAQGGIPAVVGGQQLVEIEDNEAITNRKSTSRYLSLLSAQNQAEGGVSLDGRKYGPSIFAGLDQIESSLMSKDFTPGQMLLPAGIPKAEFGMILRGPSMPAMARKRQLNYKFQDGGIASIQASQQQAADQFNMFTTELVGAIERGAERGTRQGSLEAVPEIEKQGQRTINEDNRSNNA